MIDQYGCDENDFICKINAKQALANQVAPINQTQGSSDYIPKPIHTPLTQEQIDFKLSDTIMQNQQARNSLGGVTGYEIGTNILGGLMTGMPIGTMAKDAGNFAQGINPFDTTETYDWYKGDTNSQGNPTGPSGSFERGLQGTYGNQYENDIAGLFGVGSPEHFAAIEEQMGNTPTVEAQGGWFDGLLDALGIDSSGGDNSSDDVNNATGGGGNSGGPTFHDSEHNWN